MEQKTYGEYQTLMTELRKDPKRFYTYFRMDNECFDHILGLIHNDIEKQLTNFREPIFPEERLIVETKTYKRYI